MIKLSQTLMLLKWKYSSYGILIDLIESGANSMKKYTLSIGLNDKDTKIQRINTLEAYKMIENILMANTIEGFTIYEAKGVYKHDNGEIVKENTLRVEVYDFDNTLATKIITSIHAIKAALNQESVALESQTIESELI